MIVVSFSTSLWVAGRGFNVFLQVPAQRRELSLMSEDEWIFGEEKGFLDLTLGERKIRTSCKNMEAWRLI